MSHNGLFLQSGEGKLIFYDLIVKTLILQILFLLTVCQMIGQDMLMAGFPETLAFDVSF